MRRNSECSKPAFSFLIPVTVAAALIGGMIWPMSSALAQDEDTERQIAQQATQIFRQIEARADMERCWNYVAELHQLAKSSENAIRTVAAQHRASANPRVRLAVARVYGATLGNSDEAGDIAWKLLTDAKVTDAEIIFAAAHMVARYCDTDDDVIDELPDLIDDRYDELPALAQVALARLWLVLDGDRDALARLKSHLRSSDARARAEAALALAEDGHLAETGDAVKQQAMRPGAAGDLARTVIKNDAIRQDIRRLASGGGDRPADPGFKGLPDYSSRSFLEALTLTVHRFATVREKETGTRERGDFKLHTIEEQLTAKNLLDNAARGMLRQVDEYSVFMTGKDMTDMNTEMSGQYGGIGAYVTMENGRVTITQPIYEYQKEDPPGSGQYRIVKGPAYSAGLRSGDQIIAGNGKDFSGWSLEAVINELKGTPNTPVTVTVVRRGWAEPRQFEITRDLVQITTALYEMLPGQIGYIKLTRFGYNSAEDMEKALQALERAGMKGLVLDLRDNGGGALNAVLEISDKFLSGRKLITYLQGKWGRWARRDNKYTENRQEPRTFPMAVLINHASASGSELLSGALQDHERATIIGETSFGKGVGQAFFYVLSSFGQGQGDADPEYNGFSRWLRLTTFAYYLPSGRNINKTGVEPTIPVDDKIYFRGVHYSCEYTVWEGWKLAEVNRILATKNAAGADPVQQYVDKHFPGNEALFLRLCAFDGFDTTAYPGFDEWYASLNTTLSKQDARYLLRMGRTPFRTGGLRLAAADHRGSDFAQNYPEDIVLQRGIRELAKQLNLNLGEIAEYRHFAQQEVRRPE